MIDGVVVQPLRVIPDERGKVMHMLRASDPWFHGFGEIYFSTVYPGVVKGWHLHKRMVLNYAVPVGRIKFVLFDPREGSKTKGKLQELFLGPDHYCLVQVPAGVWNGFKGIGTEPALVANCATLAHDPDEIVRMDPHANGVIPYDWSLKQG
ncbi:MAG: dTDP-4-dehydrorhamnose 3,5-epimerase family protein [Candidatus Eisenbacteria bacterium]|uniref:dTDP-4-dehydrorhamnose 3,5-epimerase family protein n=1 Tax=Eiseniibacteriota bacterium TaxID=2212470 RepID=A0A9D6LCU0_UNCEI|nr:dTDP-4-dehydrorhamnose 3,5-epimerase family protein [Candidatus Eisenbacteria bacterium]MBI3540359.1 dTDP-4-dehydrorhamnose 3,5-epimerase family protein [Candidatus Eisenbacteria bacterium]